MNGPTQYKVALARIIQHAATLALAQPIDPSHNTTLAGGKDETHRPGVRLCHSPPLREYTFSPTQGLMTA